MGNLLLADHVVLCIMDHDQDHGVMCRCGRFYLPYPEAGSCYHCLGEREKLGSCPFCPSRERRSGRRACVDTSAQTKPKCL